MNIEKKIDELQEMVSQYDTESFAGCFAHFIKNRPDDFADIDLNKFESKLKDFLYLIGLNAFSQKKGNKEFELLNSNLNILAEKLNAIKDFSYVKFKDYTIESVLHEMAFRNHFDNGVLSYVEQDLEKLRTDFTPFENKIIEDFGFDINFLVEVYKEIELVSLIRHKYVTEFVRTKEFIEFNKRVFSKEMKFSDAFNLLPENIQDAFLSFHSKPHIHLLFRKEDINHRLPKEKVDKFLELFSIEPHYNGAFKYYSAENPFELKPILKLSENNYLNIHQKQIPTAIYKQLYTYFFNDKNYNAKLRKLREKNLEKKVSAMFKAFFPSKQSFIYENYFVEKNSEQDLLIIYKGTAIIIETKASKLREPFRDIQKATIRLKSDFKDSIQYGYNQCKRVEDYFLDIECFDIKDEKEKTLFTVNPDKIHSVYSIVVTLERFGSLQTDLGLLLQKEQVDDFPWSVYIDDLEIFLLALKQHSNNPTGNFFEFLKIRKKMHGRLYAIDELDICASYLQNPEKFKKDTKTKEAFLTFSPYQQREFDKLYNIGKLKFKERPLPDDFYRFEVL